MLVNFEDITQELSDEEKEMIPILIRGFSLRSIDNPIKEPEVCSKINEYLLNNKQYLHLKLTGARLRKCVNYIRTNGLLPLIATSNGYFVSYDRSVIEKQILSLEQRARSIKTCADGLKKFIV